MISQLKAEFFKFRKSSIFRVSFLIIFGIVFISLIFGEMSFFAAGDGMVSYIGFQAKSYSNLNEPAFTEILKSSFAYSGFFWIITLFLTALFFVKEYNSGTIKLAVATGVSRWNIYIAKVITIITFVLFFYLFYVIVFTLIEVFQTGYLLQMKDLLYMSKIFLLNYLVLIAFAFFVIFLCVLLQNVGFVIGISCIYIFAGISVYIMVWYKMDEITMGMKSFIYCNPMYYWMNYCSNSYASTAGLCVYLLINIFLLAVGGLLLKNREIK